MRHGGASGQEQARGVGVETVHQPTLAGRWANPQKLGEARDERVGRGAELAGLERVRRHPGGLVGHHHVLVSVDDGQRQVWLRGRRVRRRPLDGEALAGPHRLPFGRPQPVDAHAALGDPLHGAAPADAEQLRHHLVEPPAGMAFGDLLLVGVGHQAFSAASTCCAAQEVMP